MGSLGGTEVVELAAVDDASTGEVADVDEPERGWLFAREGKVETRLLSGR
jgi:hypothetical protein